MPLFNQTVNNMVLLGITLIEAITLGVGVAVVGGILWLISEFQGLKQAVLQRPGGMGADALKLTLQAYERLTLFAQRAGIKDLVGRSSFPDQSAAGLHADLLEALKTEYEYNASQQVYVSKEVWEAVTRLRDQNTYIINQIAASLPAEARAVDLKRLLLEYALNDKAELNVIVLDAIQFEAKKLMLNN